MSYIHKPASKPLKHETPFQILHSHAKTKPEKEAFVFRDEKGKRISLTFQEYEEKSIQLASAFVKLGLVRGDKVLLLLPTCLEFTIVLMALNRIGANVFIIEVDAYPAIIEIKGLACVITSTENDERQEHVIENIKKALDNMKAVVMIGSNANPLQGFKNVYNYKELFDVAEASPDAINAVKIAEAEVQMDDPALVLFTSGTTSTPKPIQYTNFGYVNGSIVDASVMMIDEQSVLFSDSPFDWVSGLMFGIGVVITTGSTLVVFPPKLAFKGGLVPTIMKTIDEENCTHAIMLAYFLHDISTYNDDVNFGKLKVIITGGQSSAMSLLKQVFDNVQNLSVIINGYGATEMNLVGGQLLTRSNIDTVEPAVYQIADGYEIKIVENGKLLPKNTKGELCVRSPWISFPNWDLLTHGPAHVPKAKNGWHFSNDGASLNEKGLLKIHGRVDDMIKCATESISPIDIESLLLDHPYVSKVCVVGIPDQRLHEKMCACVILTENKKDSDEDSIEKELDKYCSENCWSSTMGLLLKPHCYVFIEEFPKTRTGKMSRKLTKEKALQKLSLKN